jgi:hypothetical protein
MDFSKHKWLKSELEKEYGGYYKKYPSAFLVLDYLAQLRVHKKIDGSCVQDRDILGYIDTIVKLDFFTRVYCFYLRVASYFIKPNRKKFTIHISIKDNKFPGLSQVIRKIAEKNGWRFIFQCDNYFNLLNFVLLKSVSPYRCFIGNETKKILSKFRTEDEIIWQKLLDDELLMLDLDKSVKQDVIRTAKLVKRLGINIFVNTGDSSGNARILIDSSKYFDSKTITIAHGYFQDSTLLGVAPVRSDKLILWTEKQLLEMSDAIGKGQSKKLAYIGFPKNYTVSDVVNDSVRSLLLMGLIEDIIKDEKLRTILENVIEALKGFSDKVQLRLHPHERYGVPIIEEFVNKINIELTDGDLYSEIASADYIVGANSSTLVEAASSGKKVYVIEELLESGLEFEKVIKIKAEQISVITRSSIQAGDEDRLGFNENEISAKLEELIASMYTHSAITKSP